MLFMQPEATFHPRHSTPVPSYPAASGNMAVCPKLFAMIALLAARCYVT